MAKFHWLSERIINCNQDFKSHVLLFVDCYKNLLSLTPVTQGFLLKLLWDGK